jgi:excisionase family DNA binding protein
MRHAAGVWGEAAAALAAQVRQHAHPQVTRSLSMGKRHHAPGGRCSRARGRGRQSTDYVAGTLKRPNRTMAGSLVGLHDHPGSPARGSVTASTVAVTPSSSCPDEQPSSLGAWFSHRVRRTKRGCTVAAHPSGKAAPSLPHYLHPADVADLLHVSPKTVSRWAKEGKLPFLRTLGGHRRYPAAEIRQLAEELQVRPA